MWCSHRCSVAGMMSTDINRLFSRPIFAVNWTHHMLKSRQRSWISRIVLFTQTGCGFSSMLTWAPKWRARGSVMYTHYWGRQRVPDVKRQILTVTHNARCSRNVLSQKHQGLCLFWCWAAFVFLQTSTLCCCQTCSSSYKRKIRSLCLLLWWVLQN